MNKDGGDTQNYGEMATESFYEVEGLLRNNSGSSWFAVNEEDGLPSGGSSRLNSIMDEEG